MNASVSSQLRRIVHVPRRFTSVAWGGTERVLEQTLPLLRSRGFESHVFTSQALDTQRVGSVAGFPIARFPYLYPEWPLSEARKARYDNKGGNLVSPALANALREFQQLQLIHCHTAGLLGAECLAVARYRQLPLVLTLHGGHFAIPADELKNLAVKQKGDPRRGLPWGKGLSLLLGARSLLGDVDALVCVGLDEYEAARRALPKQRVLFLPGGVNLDDFAGGDSARGRDFLQSEAKLSLDDGLPLLLCVARLDEQKDQASLVRAWAKHMHTPCHLVLVGAETSPGYAASLRQLAHSGPGKFALLGGVAPERVPDVYAAATVSILPSRHEPFGLTCLESWASQVPLVAARVGGPGWLLQHEKEGRLFEVGNSQELAAVLTELLHDPAQCERLRQAGLERVRREFTWQIRADKLSSLYRELLDRKGAAQR